MKIAVCSDIHDNIWALGRALPLMGEAGAMICCGDLCAPFTLVQLAEGFAGPIHVVWGNNDGDKWLLTVQAARFPHLSLHGELAEIVLDGRRLGVSHYPAIAQGLARSGSYDLVCYGHDHLAHDEVVGSCRLLNPGELMGRLGKPRFVLYDLPTGIARTVEV